MNEVTLHGLRERQGIFARNIALLIELIFRSKYTCSLGEAYRPPETAKLYAEQGRGIEHSLHTDRLALDINIYNPKGEYLTDTADYKIFGDYWEKMHPDNRWGGKFSRPDGNHFEMTLTPRS